MIRRFAVVALVLGGCSFGGGPVMGYRGGRPTIGWELGAGVIGHDEGNGGAARIDGGQSWRDGRAVTYGTFSAMRMRVDEGPDRRFLGIEGSVGYGGGDGDSRLVLGAAPIAGRFMGEECSQDSSWMATFSIGLRQIGGDLELYLSPRISAVAQPCVVATEDGL